MPQDFIFSYLQFVFLVIQFSGDPWYIHLGCLTWCKSSPLGNADTNVQYVLPHTDGD